MAKEMCDWEYHPGQDNGLKGGHFAWLPCAPDGYNHLTRIGNVKTGIGVADFYNGKCCPCCGKTVKVHYNRIGGK